MIEIDPSTCTVLALQEYDRQSRYVQLQLLYTQVKTHSYLIKIAQPRT